MSPEFNVLEGLGKSSKRASEPPELETVQFDRKIDVLSWFSRGVRNRRNETGQKP